jgi:hypothetical protein
MVARVKFSMGVERYRISEIRYQGAGEQRPATGDQRSGGEKRGTVTQRSQRTEHRETEKKERKITHPSKLGARRRRGHRVHGEEKKKQIPPLRGPTRQKTARKKKSGRFGRDDRLGEARRAQRGAKQEWGEEDCGVRS